LEEDIKMDLIEIGWGWGSIRLTHDMDLWRALVNTVMNTPLPWSAVNFLSSWTTQFVTRQICYGAETVQTYRAQDGRLCARINLSSYAVVSNFEELEYRQRFPWNLQQPACHRTWENHHNVI
jgi:hypothetical protein